MPKTIKFNLICDGNPVRTIEDLRNNFSIEDILEYYNNGLLERWLHVRGYSEERRMVAGIEAEDPLKIIRKLIEIFNVTVDLDQVDESIYMLEYRKEKEQRNKRYEEQGYNADKIIENYQDGYEKIVQRIMAHPKDVAVIKAAIQELVEDYKWILNLDNRRLFRTFYDKKQYLAVMCLLMNEGTRKYYMMTEDEIIDTDNREMTAIDKNSMYRRLIDLIKSNEFFKILGKNLTIFSGNTENHWEDLEFRGKKFMIIEIGDGDYVRSQGVAKEKFPAKEVKNQFIILDGIDYMSSHANHRIVYMEV